MITTCEHAGFRWGLDIGISSTTQNLFEQVDFRDRVALMLAWTKLKRVPCLRLMRNSLSRRTGARLHSNFTLLCKFYRSQWIALTNALSSSGRNVLLKLWSPKDSEDGNIDIESVQFYGYSGPRFFQATEAC